MAPNMKLAETFQQVQQTSSNMVHQLQAEQQQRQSISNNQYHIQQTEFTSLQQMASMVQDVKNTNQQILCMMQQLQIQLNLIQDQQNLLQQQCLSNFHNYMDLQQLKEATESADKGMEMNSHLGSCQEWQDPANILWSGKLQFIDHMLKSQLFMLPCEIYRTYVKDKNLQSMIIKSCQTQLSADLVPCSILSKIDQSFLKNTDTIYFQPIIPCKHQLQIQKILFNHVAFVFFSSTPNNNLKAMVLKFSADQKIFEGIIPKNQQAFHYELINIIRLQSSKPHNYNHLNLGGIYNRIQDNYSLPQTVTMGTDAATSNIHLCSEQFTNANTTVLPSYLYAQPTYRTMSQGLTDSQSYGNFQNIEYWIKPVNAYTETEQLYPNHYPYSEQSTRYIILPLSKSIIGATCALNNQQSIDSATMQSNKSSMQDNSQDPINVENSETVVPSNLLQSPLSQSSVLLQYQDLQDPQISKEFLSSSIPTANEFQINTPVSLSDLQLKTQTNVLPLQSAQKQYVNVSDSGNRVTNCTSKNETQQSTPTSTLKKVMQQVKVTQNLIPVDKGVISKQPMTYATVQEDSSIVQATSKPLVKSILQTEYSQLTPNLIAQSLLYTPLNLNPHRTSSNVSETEKLNDELTIINSQINSKTTQISPQFQTQKLHNDQPNTDAINLLNNKSENHEIMQKHIKCSNSSTFCTCQDKKQLEAVETMQMDHHKMKEIFSNCLHPSKELHQSVNTEIHFSKHKAATNSLHEEITSLVKSSLSSNVPDAQNVEHQSNDTSKKKIKKSVQIEESKNQYYEECDFELL